MDGYAGFENAHPLWVILGYKVNSIPGRDLQANLTTVI